MPLQIPGKDHVGRLFTFQSSFASESVVASQSAILDSPPLQPFPGCSTNPNGPSAIIDNRNIVNFNKHL